MRLPMGSSQQIRIQGESSDNDTGKWLQWIIFVFLVGFVIAPVSIYVIFQLIIFFNLGSQVQTLLKLFVIVFLPLIFVGLQFLINQLTTPQMTLTEVSMGIDMSVGGIAFDVSTLLLFINNKVALINTSLPIQPWELFIPVITIVMQFIILLLIALILRIAHEEENSSKRVFFVQMTNIVGFFNIIIPLFLIMFTIGVD